MLDSSIFLIRQPHGAAARRPPGDDALAGFILSANNRRDRELFIRYWLVHRDTAQLQEVLVPPCSVAASPSQELPDPML
jgi:hypothetical protein